MVSLAELVKGSERVELPNNITLLVPEGQKHSYIVSHMGRCDESNNPFRNLERGRVLDELVSWGDHIVLRNLALYIVAPGKWNGERAYHVMAIGDGTSIMAPLAICDDKLNARLMRTHSM